MAVLGINLEKNGLRYCVLDGGKDSPNILHYEKVQTNNFPNTQQLMNWYETTFQNLITKFAPESIGIKVSLNAKKAEITPWYYPLGILHNLSHQNRISTFEFVTGNFTASKFGMDKSVNIYDYIDQHFGIFKPKWDRNQKYALLSAWMILK
ncbi:hypothetical protein DENIS_2552 [Desulfonema ishimotonii]|uniref:Uncharacterized protein n=1 Tax=Desulfonema ishimotonii TaxID=45657 RepID=A0A401FX98_9BACT|nr:hypothetical protein [Desulfonema ishimotonii]GBC61590.1 hypothetical protein DENIS_2552 [Desulfonema ishimotonii]